MDNQEHRFEDTMDVLEADREATEIRFRELLDELSRHVGDVRDAADRSTALHAARRDARRRAHPDSGGGIDATDGAVPDEPARGWPQGRGGGRGLLNRFAAWLMRDFLETIDRRGEAQGRRLEALEVGVGSLKESASADEASYAALNEALSGAQAALQAALSTQREMLDLVNAKDAEVLQRAVAGPLRRMEILFDEFGRQQEALLSQLVGRRQELDDLVRRLTPTPEEKT